MKPIYIRPEIHRSVKTEAAKRGVPLFVLVEEFLMKSMKKKKNESRG